MDPPGVGIEYGVSAQVNLIREFKEGVGLDIEVFELLFVSEFKKGKFHTMELFFRVEKVADELVCGTDPEMEQNQQILSDVKLMNFKEINGINPKNKHNLFKQCNSIPKLLNMSGFYYNN